jgi:hypothetical protein
LVRDVLLRSSLLSARRLSRRWSNGPPISSAVGRPQPREMELQFYGRGLTGHSGLSLSPSQAPRGESINDRSGSACLAPPLSTVTCTILICTSRTDGLLLFSHEGLTKLALMNPS